ncbi:hypothetical protein VUR80DRAFT_10228 [Thermomyces stellatus]
MNWNCLDPGLPSLVPPAPWTTHLATLPASSSVSTSLASTWRARRRPLRRGPPLCPRNLAAERIRRRSTRPARQHAPPKRRFPLTGKTPRAPNQSFLRVYQLGAVPMVSRLTAPCVSTIPPISPLSCTLSTAIRRSSDRFPRPPVRVPRGVPAPYEATYHPIYTYSFPEYNPLTHYSLVDKTV